jgi:hypothetical protein
VSIPVIHHMTLSGRSRISVRYTIRYMPIRVNSLSRPIVPRPKASLFRFYLSTP